MTHLFPTTRPGHRIAFDNGFTGSREKFLAEAQTLASALPPSRHLVNLCRDRYQFMRAFVAGLLLDQPTLLPPSRVPQVVADVAGRYRQTQVVTDDAKVAGFNIRDITADTAPSALTDIPDGQLAAIAFTSGSTGQPTAHKKYWGTLAGTAQRLAARFAITPDTPIVATVPSQHMYGLEMTILMALQAEASLYLQQPFYPRDLAQVLSLAAGAVLVTTPVHLRAFAAAGLAFTGVARVISATAPLSTDLAATCERLFGCEVHEIYGCTEGGSIATRRTVAGDTWQLLPDMHLQHVGGAATLHAPHLPEPVPLQDTLEPAGDGFRLLGRNEDMLNVGGKRYSLAELNLRLQGITGIRDAYAFVPPSDRAVERPAAFVVTDREPRDISRELAALIDPAFIPRPIIPVNVIPRNETGKVLRDVVIRLYAER